MDYGDTHPGSSQNETVHVVAKRWHIFDLADCYFALLLLSFVAEFVFYVGVEVLQGGWTKTNLFMA